jgi:hypothetical protein
VQDHANRGSDESRQITSASQCILKKNDVSRDEISKRIKRRRSAVGHGAWDVVAGARERKETKLTDT